MKLPKTRIDPNTSLHPSTSCKAECKECGFKYHYNYSTQPYCCGYPHLNVSTALLVAKKRNPMDRTDDQSVFKEPAKNLKPCALLHLIGGIDVIPIESAVTPRGREVRVGDRFKVAVSRPVGMLAMVTKVRKRLIPATNCPNGPKDLSNPFELYQADKFTEHIEVEYRRQDGEVCVIALAWLDGHAEWDDQKDDRMGHERRLADKVTGRTNGRAHLELSYNPETCEPSFGRLVVNDFHGLPAEAQETIIEVIARHNDD